MSGASGEYLDLTRASYRPVQWAGAISIAVLSRLSAELADNSGQATVGLLAKNDGGQVSVQGNVEAKLVLTCQRCFKNLVLPVKAGFTLAWVRNEAQAADLPDSYEPLLSASGRVKIADLIEDELLLALPLVAMHQTLHECGIRAGAVPNSDVSRHEASRTRPFAALGRLKHR